MVEKPFRSFFFARLWSSWPAGIRSLLVAEDLSFTVTPPLAEAVKDWLTASGISIGVHADDWEREVLGQKLIVGDVTLAVFNGRAVSGPEHLAALDSAPEAARIVKFAPKDKNGGVVIYAADRRKRDEPIAPMPWGLTDIPEHRHFLTLR